MLIDASSWGTVAIGIGLGLLGYPYLLYPWIVRHLPFKPHPPNRGTDGTKTSVVIAARSPGAAIAAKVSNLLREHEALVDEVIVVLDGADPIGRDALRSLACPALFVHELPRPCGKAVALNFGVEQASGAILIMTDARQRVGPRAIARLKEQLAAADVGAVSAALEIQKQPGRSTLLDSYWSHERELRAAEAAWDSAIGVSGALYAIKREFWQPLRSGLLLDDLAVAMEVVRRGSRVAFATDALVEDVPIGTDATEFARKVRTLTGNFQYLAWYPWVLLPWRNRLWWQFMSHKVLRLLTPLASVLVLAGIMLLGGAAVAMVMLLALLGILMLKRGAGPVSRISGLLRSALMLEAALVVATVNALRQRWDVWSDPARPTTLETKA